MEAKEVLRALFGEEEEVCFRVFDDKKGGSFPGQKYSVLLKDYDKLEPCLKEHNKRHRGVFFVVNYGGKGTLTLSASTPSLLNPTALVSAK